MNNKSNEQLRQIIKEMTISFSNYSKEMSKIYDKLLELLKNE